MSVMMTDVERRTKDPLRIPISDAYMEGREACKADSTITTPTRTATTKR
jgi:hypothetical protein